MLSGWKSHVAPIVLSVGLASCQAATTDTPPTTEPDPQTVPIAAGACPLGILPGPDDPAPGGASDLMDTSDMGSGRWRLCLDEPVELVAEGWAYCSWNDDRTEVREAAGLPIQLAAGSVDGGIALDRGEVYLASTAIDGAVGSYTSGHLGPRIQAELDGTSGVARFLAAASLDREHPPAIRPADLVGTIRWECGAPPPP